MSGTRPSSSPTDPRPGSDGPANFFLDADFQLTGASAAIDNAWEATAVTTDFLGNSQVTIPGAGLGLAGYGPRDVGAFEFDGIRRHSCRRCVPRRHAPRWFPSPASSRPTVETISVTAAPTSVTVTFSGTVNPSDIKATDLVLSGTALNGLAPAHATSLTWIDAHTVEFNLTGQFNTAGTLNVSLAPNAVQSSQGTRSRRLL